MRTNFMANFDENLKKQLTQVMASENEILDCMLNEQSLLHDNVKERNWEQLEHNLLHIEAFSNAFVELDSKREEIASIDNDIYYSMEVAPFMTQLRSKLSRSKIENEALNTYVQTTQNFIGGVIDAVMPTNKVYGRNGSITQRQITSIVLNSYC